MDAQYIDIGGAEDADVYTDFQPALTILTTVLNAQYEGRATTDAGAKACTINRPWSRVRGETGMSYTSGSDEFGSIRYEDNASRTYAVGDKAGADRVPLRPGGEPVRPDVRGPQRHRRGRLGHRARGHST